MSTTDQHLLIVSTSTVFGQPYLEYIKPRINAFFTGKKRICFIPYARPAGITHDQYTEKATAVFESLGFEMKGLHTFSSADEGVAWADGFFTGGGNTFELTRCIHELGLIRLLKGAVAAGKPYMGTSAGANITGHSISTTNDMPIVYPPSFEALGLVPFNINPHYLDPDPESRHMGESRETRIKEFHVFNSQPVVGLREGSALEVHDRSISIYGSYPVRLFRQQQEPVEVEEGSQLTRLLYGGTN